MWVLNKKMIFLSQSLWTKKGLCNDRFSNWDCRINWHKWAWRNDEYPIACEKFCDDTRRHDRLSVLAFVHAKRATTAAEGITGRRLAPRTRYRKPRRRQVRVNELWDSDTTHHAGTCRYTRWAKIRDVLDYFSIDKENVWYAREAM